MMTLDDLINQLVELANTHGDEWMVLMRGRDRRVILDPGEVLSIESIEVESFDDGSHAVHLTGEPY